MKLFLPLATLALAGGLFFLQAADNTVKPLRVLIVAGGCCHEYDKQTMALKEGLESRLNAIVYFELLFVTQKTSEIVQNLSEIFC